MRKIYLDNNGTTGLHPKVIEAMQEVLTPIPLNASSIHFYGQEAKSYLTRSRDSIAHSLGVRPQEIIFTSGATEALNYLIRGFYKVSPGAHIISSDVEHPAVKLTLADLQREGAEVTYLPAGLWGAVRPEAVEKAITSRTQLITLMAVNNVTGVKTDIEAIASIAYHHRIPFIVDGVQWLGKEKFHLPKGISGIAFSAHKIHGPQGVGAAILRSTYKIPTLITGGSQENGRRGGTENIAGIVGFAKATELCTSDVELAAEHMKKLRNRLVEGLSSLAGHIVIHGLGPKVCNTAHIGFPNADGETLLIQLSQAGIAASAGSACTSGGLEPSSVLMAMGIPYALAKASLRFSVSRQTTLQDIEDALNVMKMILKRS